MALSRDIFWLSHLGGCYMAGQHGIITGDPQGGPTRTLPTAQERPAKTPTKTQVAPAPICLSHTLPRGTSPHWLSGRQWQEEKVLCSWPTTLDA